LKLAAAQSDLRNRIAVAWVDVLAAQALRDLFTRALATATAQAEQEDRRFHAGEGTRDAVAEATAQRNSMRARLAEGLLELQARVQAFNLLTRLGVAGLDDNRLPAVAELGLIAEPEQGMLDRILESNPELAAARENEALNERRLAQASADHLPTLDLVGAVNRAENDTTNTLGTRYRNSQVGVQLMIPIFSGGAVSASERQAAAAHAAATADRDAVAQRLRIQFGADWRAQAGLRERALGAMELVQAALEQRRAVELSVKKGFKTWGDVGNVNQMLVRRESDVVDAIGQLLKTQARLLSLLPTTDTAWDRWASGLTSLMR
jgi:protease secretion system outer membrane protein